MNTAKHTQGPWHLSECATQTTKAGIVSVDGLHITDICGYGMTDNQNQANANLIAAAPAMYEALHVLCREIQGAVSIENGIVSFLDGGYLDINPILAQAEGKH